MLCFGDYFSALIEAKMTMLVDTDYVQFEAKFSFVFILSCPMCLFSLAPDASGILPAPEFFPNIT